MSWYSSSWQRRAAIAVDNRTGNSGGPYDVTLTIPPEWGLFWGSVLATGLDIRVCRADGRTLISHHRETWTYASRAGVINIEDAILTEEKWSQLWLYWGNSTATETSSSFTLASERTGYIYAGLPGRWRASAAPERPDATKPRRDLAKLSAEAGWVWFDFRPQLLEGGPNEGRRIWEEIASLTSFEVLNVGGTNQTGMLDLAKIQMIDGWVGCWLQAGSSGTPYVGVCKVVTTQGRTLEARARIPVRDPTV